MSSSPAGHVTDLLTSIGDGDPSAAERLLPIVYDELRRLAHQRMAREPPGQTFQPTDLVHEAYLRLIGDTPVKWESRGHFFAAAARAMRRILVERARRRAAVKHGGDLRRTPLDDVPAPTPDQPDLTELDAALDRLERADRRAAEVVMLRYFAGLSIDETAQAVGVSPATVKREWEYARTWLHDALRERP